MMHPQTAECYKWKYSEIGGDSAGGPRYCVYRTWGWGL